MQGYDVLWLTRNGPCWYRNTSESRRKTYVKKVFHVMILVVKNSLEKTWEWKEEYASHIRQQWAKIGLGLDYSRERFTLDEGLSRCC